VHVYVRVYVRAYNNIHMRNNEKGEKKRIIYVRGIL